MEFHYLDRKSYRNKYSSEIIDELKNRFGNFYLLPEGGTNELAVKGCSEIFNGLNDSFDYFCCACGTGGTLAGIINGLCGKKFALGFSVLKGASFLRENVSSLLKSLNGTVFKNWEINLNYHFGGYAKFNDQLFNFINEFSNRTKIPLEPIYTGKMLFGIYDLIAKGYFSKGSKIIALHSGGLQGLCGLTENKKVPK